MITTLLVSLGLTFALMGLVDWGLGLRLPGWAIIALYLALYAVLSWFGRSRRLTTDDEPAPDYSHWPTSGPIGRFGQRGLRVPWLLTNTLSILNPLQAVQVFRQLVGNAELERRARQRGDDGSGYRTQAIYTLPFDGEWLLYNGGMTPKTSHSWDVLGQRFALDFVQADAAFARHRGRGTHPGDYYCYDAPILAAADGVVVTVEQRIGLAPLLGWGVCDFTARSFVGNHVLIEHAEGEYALYAHLVKDSVTVRPGDRVLRGQTIGRCGHTGHSTEPHLHFHLQDSASLFAGMGLPVAFTALAVDGQPVGAAHLTAGQRVRAQRPAERAATP